jgi:hypothetical protein
MVMKIKFTKALQKDSGLLLMTNKPFLPIIDDTVYTVTFDFNDNAHFFIGSTELACGARDALMNIIAADYAHLVNK